MRHWILTLALLFCGVVDAVRADNALPAVFKVTGVMGGDVLNIRSGPSVDHPVIGGLPNGAEVEVTARTGDGWARILQGEGNGWLAARYLEAQSAAEIPEELFCGGTEPFWSLTLDPDNSLTFTGMDGEPLKIPPDWRHNVTGSQSGSFAVGSDHGIALFHRRDCSDGMSDRTYGWALDFLRTGGQGAFWQGCCRMLR